MRVSSQSLVKFSDHQNNYAEQDLDLEVKGLPILEQQKATTSRRFFSKFKTNNVVSQKLSFGGLKPKENLLSSKDNSSRTSQTKRSF